MPTELRVLSYNVRSLRDDPQAVAAVIRSCEPDVVCIQEAPRFLRWRSKCAELARESGLVVVTGGRTAAAMLVMVSLRVRVISAHDILLSRKRGLHQRGIALATLQLGASRFCAASIHLDLDAEERRRHVDEIVARTSMCADPLIVAGDINEEPEGPAWRALAEKYPDAYASGRHDGGHTYSATRPERRIDGIFADERITVLRCGVPDVPDIERASDHRPVLAVLRLP